MPKEIWGETGTLSESSKRTQNPMSDLNSEGWVRNNYAVSAGLLVDLFPSLLSFIHLFKTAFCVLLGGNYLTLHHLFLQYFNIKPTRKTTNSRLVLRAGIKISRSLILGSVNSSW